MFFAYCKLPLVRFHVTSNSLPLPPPPPPIIGRSTCTQKKKKFKSRYNDTLYNDVDITMNTLCPCVSYSKMYETEPRYKDIPDITGIKKKKKKKKKRADHTKTSFNKNY